MTRRSRTLALLALTAPLAATLLAASATPALASGSFAAPTPSEGAVLSSGTFTVSATIASGSNPSTLDLTGRDAAGTVVCSLSKSTSGGIVLQTQTLSLASISCPAKNATWSAMLSGGATGSRSFATNAAPSVPSQFTADGSGSRDVSFRWTRGSEADLTSYALYDGAGNPIDGAISLSHCNGSLCSYALYYPDDNPGSHSYQLSATRSGSGCSGCANALESSRASASATLADPPPPPPPSPTPTPSPTDGSTTGGTTGGTPGGTTSGGGTTGGGTTGGTPGGGTTGGTSGGGTSGSTALHPGTKPTLPTLPSTLAAARRAFALSFNAFSPSLGISKLPPLPAAFAPTISPLAPLPLGTFQPTLPYKPQTTTVRETSVLRQITSVGNTVDPEQLAKSIAVALILLLIGAHLRRFLAVRGD